MSTCRVMAAVALFAAFGHAVPDGQGREPSRATGTSEITGGAESQEGESLTACSVGGGIYRPFSLLRRAKLGTAYFVNPTLPDTAKILYAYNLDDLKSPLSGDAQFAVAVDNDVAGALAPVYWDTAAGGIIPIPCRSLPSDVPDGGAPKIAESWFAAMPSRPYVSDDGAPRESWFAAMPSDMRKQIHVLSGEPLDADTHDRWVTWDPTEAVVATEPEERQ